MLSPTFDLLPVDVIMLEDGEQLALALNEKKTHIRRKDFLVFAEECGMARSSAEKNDRHACGKKRETYGHVPRFSVAGVFAETSCQPNQRTGEHIGRIKRSFQGEKEFGK